MDLKRNTGYKSYYSLYESSSYNYNNLLDTTVIDASGNASSGGTSGGGTNITNIITGGGVEIGDTLTGLVLVDTQNLNATNITTNNITTNILNVTTINGFTSSLESDVTLLGSSADNKIFWDSSANTLYVDAELNVSDSFITLNDDPDVANLTSSDGQDKGFFFKWYDSGEASEKLGFMGFDLSTERFKVYSDVTESGGAVTSGTYGDYQLDKVYTTGLNNYDSLDLDIIVNNGDFLTGLTDGSYDVLVSGPSGGAISLVNETSSIYLKSDFNNIDAIKLETTAGGINLDSDNTLTLSSTNGDILIGSNTGSVNNSVNVDFNVDVNSSANVMNFNEADGLTVQNPKTDYKKWFPYSKFDFKNSIWSSTREIVSGNPVYYWLKDAIADTTYLNIDLTESIREATNKGLRLTSVYFYYEVENQTLTSLNLVLTKKTFSSITQELTVSNIPYTDNNLLVGTAIDTHYRSVNITTPFFVNDDSTISCEIEFQSQASTTLKFYGMMCNFDYNHL